MKRFFAGMVAVLTAAILFFPVKVQAISAEHAIVIDADSGRILYEKNANEKSLIASTTKIMTALIVCEQCNVLDRMKIPKEAVGIEGSSMYLKEGEILTIQELLYGLMLHSGNDAAVALAIYCGGTVAGFAELMNDKAHKLGMKNTHFENPHGLDSSGHYSTAADMAVLAAYAMENPIFHQTVSTKEIKAGGRYLHNHNKLLWLVDGAEGIKTGYTKAAGRILVSSACRNDRRLIAVTINAPDDWNDHRKLLYDGFAGYSLEKIISKDACLGHVEIAGGTAGKAELIAAEDFSYVLAVGESVQIELPEPGFVYAPVVCGQSAGEVYVCINGKPVGTVPVVYGQTIEQMAYEEPSILEKLLGGRRK